MRNLFLGAVAALSMTSAALGQEDGMADFNYVEENCRVDDADMPMAPLCHVLVYEQWRLASGLGAEQSYCDMAAFWRVADEVITPELRQRPFVEAFDLVIQQGGVCREGGTSEPAELN